MRCKWTRGPACIFGLLSRSTSVPGNMWIPLQRVTALQCCMGEGSFQWKGVFFTSPPAGNTSTDRAFWGSHWQWISFRVTSPKSRNFCFGNTNFLLDGFPRISRRWNVGRTSVIVQIMRLATQQINNNKNGKDYSGEQMNKIFQQKVPVAFPMIARTVHLGNSYSPLGDRKKQTAYRPYGSLFHNIWIIETNFTSCVALYWGTRPLFDPQNAVCCILF